jgi:hypothetical protein
MKKYILLLFCFCFLPASAQYRQLTARKNIPLDSIYLSDPCILADRKTSQYYMTGTGGMLWKSWVYGDYTQGVAYSESGMLFRTLEGKLLMSVHSHKTIHGRTIRIPHLFEMDDSGDKLVLGKPYALQGIVK